MEQPKFGGIKNKIVLVTIKTPMETIFYWCFFLFYFQLLKKY
mgnify:CR=1 FL=1